MDGGLVAPQLLSPELLRAGPFGRVLALESALQGLRKHAEGAADLGEGGLCGEGVPGGRRGTSVARCVRDVFLFISFSLFCHGLFFFLLLFFCFFFSLAFLLSKKKKKLTYRSARGRRWEGRDGPAARRRGAPPFPGRRVLQPGVLAPLCGFGRALAGGFCTLGWFPDGEAGRSRSGLGLGRSRGSGRRPLVVARRERGEEGVRLHRGARGAAPRALEGACPDRRRGRRRTRRRSEEAKDDDDEGSLRGEDEVGLKTFLFPFLSFLYFNFFSQRVTHARIT